MVRHSVIYLDNALVPLALRSIGMEKSLKAHRPFFSADDILYELPPEEKKKSFKNYQFGFLIV